MSYYQYSTTGTTTLLAPTITTAAMPMTCFVNAPVLTTPGIVYETRFAAPIYSTEIPLVGIDVKAHKSKEATLCETRKTIESNARLDDYIKMRVDEQIKKFQADQSEKSSHSHVVVTESHITSSPPPAPVVHETIIEKKVVDCNCHCNCSCNKETAKLEKAFDLDDKIRAIREELGLADALTQEELTYKLHNRRDDDYSDLCTYKYVVNQYDRRSRSKSAERTAKSRSKSPALNSRPPWRPTGSNDYTSTYLRRADLILNSESKSRKSCTDHNNYNYYHAQSASYNPPRPATSCDNNKTQYYTYYASEPKHSYYTVDTIKPAKTIIKTTIDTKKTFKSTPSDYYVTASYNQLPSIHTKSVKQTPWSYSSHCGAPKYTKNYPVASGAEYVCFPVQRTKSYTNLICD